MSFQQPREASRPALLPLVPPSFLSNPAIPPPHQCWRPHDQTPILLRVNPHIPLDGALNSDHVCFRPVPYWGKVWACEVVRAKVGEWGPHQCSFECHSNFSYLLQQPCDVSSLMAHLHVEAKLKEGRTLCPKTEQGRHIN